MSFFKTVLLILTLTMFQCFASTSAAAPEVFFTGHNTNRLGPHSLPGGFPVGDKVQVITVFDSSDAIGSPSISVEAVQGGTTLTLDRVPLGSPMFDSYHVYYKFIDFDPGLLGPWQITPTDNTGVGLTAFTPTIVEPEFLPLVEDVTVRGTPIGARIDWTLPELGDFDPDVIRVRLIDAATGGHLWESQALSVQTTSFTPPVGTLQVGVEYVYAVILGDWSGADLENASWGFSEPFRFTVPGDFNMDGVVNAADYVLWRDQSSQLGEHNTWRDNFGQAVGSGSFADRAVPEPASLALLVVAGVVLLALHGRRG